jgi:hypothetical protein
VDWAGEDGAITLHDEDGAAFRFLPVRLLREGAELFLIAEREGEGTLHVLRREGEMVGLVRDGQTLRRISFRLEILRRAMEGEAIERPGEPPQVLGVIHRGDVEGRGYVVAADLADPATVVAFETNAAGLVPADAGLLAAIREQLEEPLLALEAAAPQLEAASLGLRGERIEVATPGGPRVYETAGRLFFEGRDLLFVRHPGEATSGAAEVLPDGRLEAVSDEPFLGRLRAHLEAAR